MGTVQSLKSMIELMNNQVAGMQFVGMLSRVSLRRAAFLRKALMAWLAGLVITTFSLLAPLPAMASAQQLGAASNGVLAMSTLAAMSTVASLSGKAKAAAKDTEGKVESAYGDLTGDKGRQVKGAAKQLQGSAMNAGEDVKEGAKSVAKKVGDATR